MSLVTGDYSSGVKDQVKFGTVGTTQSIMFRVTGDDGTPLVGIGITPVIIREPEGVSQRMRLSPANAVTDAVGAVQFELSPGNKPGRYDVLFFQRGLPGERIAFTRFEFVAQDTNWATMLVLSLAGGLAIFLFGMKIASEGLQGFAGNRLRTGLADMTKSPARGVFLGIGLTGLTQSSGATTVMLMSFVRAKLLSFRNSLGVVLGAAIGGTITVQLISFNLFAYALPAIALGFVLHFLATSPRLKAAGLACLGFGLVFFGMKIMTDQMTPLKSFPFFTGAVQGLGNHPIWAVLLSALFTAAAQSSGATVGIVLSLARQDLITLHEAIPMFFGASIGICFTGFTASVGAPPEAKRVALAHLVYKICGTALFLPLVGVLAVAGLKVTTLLQFGDAANAADIAARAVANTYTLYMIITALITLACIPLLEKLCLRLIPDVPDYANGEVRTKYLDLKVVDTPVVAIGSSRREISRMGRFVEEMMKRILVALIEKDPKSVSFIRQRDNKVDMLNSEITHYLTALTRRTLSETETAEATELLYIVSDLESIGDIIDKNLVPLSEKMISFNRDFSEEGRMDLQALHRAVSERLSQMVIALATNNTALAEPIISGFEPLQIEGKRLHLRHLQRLQASIHESIETSSVHLDAINYLLRIDYLIYNICLHIVGRARQPVMAAGV
jgi:phosphate:Na+ symporter